MPWFKVGERKPSSKTGTYAAFEQADRVVVEVFADLHEARHLKSKPSPTYHQVRCNGQSFRRGSSPRLILEIDIRELLPGRARRSRRTVPRQPKGEGSGGRA